jgi:hypothetical protein
VALASPGTVTTADRVWVLESSGPRVHDTTLTFAAAAGRSIVLHHEGMPDAIFLILDFPATRDTLHLRDSVLVAVHPADGQYGFTVSFNEKAGVTPEATLAYAMYFRTPAAAVATWPSPGRFEQRLQPALLGQDNKFTITAGERPAGDMLRFALKTSGTYALVALK